MEKTSFQLQSILHESELLPAVVFASARFCPRARITSHFSCHQDAVELSEGHALVEECRVVVAPVEVIAMGAVPCQTLVRSICIVVEMHETQQFFVERRPLCSIDVVLDSDLVPPRLILRS